MTAPQSPPPPPTTVGPNDPPIPPPPPSPVKFFPMIGGIGIAALGLLFAIHDHDWVPLLFIPFGIVLAYFSKDGWS